MVEGHFVGCFEVQAKKPSKPCLPISERIMKPRPLRDIPLAFRDSTRSSDGFVVDEEWDESSDLSDSPVWEEDSLRKTNGQSVSKQAGKVGKGQCQAAKQLKVPLKKPSAQLSIMQSGAVDGDKKKSKKAKKQKKDKKHKENDTPKKEKKEKKDKKDKKEKKHKKEKKDKKRKKDTCQDSWGFGLSMVVQGTFFGAELQKMYSMT